MRASATFRFLVPLLIGMSIGVLFMVFMLIPPTDATFPLWNKISPVFVFLNYPAKVMMNPWLARFPDYPVTGCIFTVLAQWLLIGSFAGSAWAYFGRAQKKPS